MRSDGPVSHPPVPVARFQSMEEAGAFCAIARECGVKTSRVDLQRSTSGFDGTLGGTTHLMAYCVWLNAEDLPLLREHLASSMEIDPLDPLHTAGRAELLAMVQGPVDGNLCEQVIAGKILNSLPPQEAPNVAISPETDAHSAADRRKARWLGVTGVGFTTIYLTIFLNSIFLSADPDSDYASRSFNAGIRILTSQNHDSIADNIRPFLITSVPMAVGATLFLSRRQLRDGRVRRMFPPFWQSMGHLLFWLPPLVVAFFLMVR